MIEAKCGWRLQKLDSRKRKGLILPEKKARSDDIPRRRSGENSGGPLLSAPTPPETPGLKITKERAERNRLRSGPNRNKTSAKESKRLAMTCRHIMQKSHQKAREKKKETMLPCQ